MTREEVTICKVYLNDLDRTHDCNEYKLLMELLNREPCEDCVSRKAVIKAVDSHTFDTNNGLCLDDDISCILEELSPVTPTRKKGKWIFTKTIFDKYRCTVECPSCHKKWKTYDEIRWEKENKFCPNCGTEMESEKNEQSSIKSR